MGYGPVRAATGVTQALDPMRRSRTTLGILYDATTIPTTLSGGSALLALAALDPPRSNWRCPRPHLPGRVVVNQLDTMFVAASPERPTLLRSTRHQCVCGLPVLATTNGASSQSA